MKTTRLFSLLLLLALLTTTVHAQTRYYVDWDAEGSDTGTSWANAYLKLQTALALAVDGDEIWVAAGTYYPDEGTGQTEDDLSSNFQLITGVSIYGGFYGDETTLDQRDVMANPSVLSGDIDQDGSTSGNAYHVVRGNGADATALLDGFTITAGYAFFASSSPRRSGGGLFIVSGSPTLARLTITGNAAQNDGGGLFLNDSQSALIGCTIAGNSAMRDGGGLYALNSNPTLTGTTVDENTSTEKGAGLYIDSESSVVLTGATITRNAATGNGGGLFNQSSGTKVRSTILSGNADAGGTDASAQLHNNGGATPTVRYSMLRGSGGSGAAWDANLGTDGGGNLDVNPELGGLADNGGATETRLPTRLSLLIDAGSCFSQSQDQRGLLRPYNANDSNFPNADDGCDIGAVELQMGEVSNLVVYVDAGAMGLGNGTSWEDAFTSLQDARAEALAGEAIWVAAGTYYPDEGAVQTDNDRTASFRLKNGVAIYGGFAGDETMLEARDVVANETILSGDIDQGSGNDGNSNHVVDGTGRDPSAILDGFTIRAGNASRSFGDPHSLARGGGVYINTGSPTLRNNTIENNRAYDSVVSLEFFLGTGGGVYIGSGSPELTGNTIRNNTSSYGGGGVMIVTGSPTLRQNRITQNNSDSRGGGIYNDSGSPVITENRIANNTGVEGGGIYSGQGIPVVTNNTITDNRARGSGGGLYIYHRATLIGNTITNNVANFGNGGGLYLVGNVTLISNTITGNRAPGIEAVDAFGGGIYNLNSNTQIRGTILWGNEDKNGGIDASAQLHNQSATPKISYSIVQGSGGSGAGWDASLGEDQGNNLDADPMLGPLQDNGGPTLTQLPTSPFSPTVDAIPVDAADKTSALGCGTDSITDQRGLPRPADGNGDGIAACDIGATEGQSPDLLPVELVAFTATLDGTTGHLRWETAAETNNAGFEIQQREANTNTNWSVLGFVDGMGTTTVPQAYTFDVAGLTVGTHVFRLKQVDYDGTFAHSPEVEVTVGMVGSHELSAAYPNPFNPSTQLRLAVGRTQEVRVVVYDLLGRQVARLFSGSLEAGRTQVLAWQAGARASGVYVIRVEGETFAEVRLVVLAK